MSKKQRPKTVYKYRNLEDVNHLRILITNEIYFPVSSQLNDPFDCGIPFAFWLGSVEKVKEYLRIILPSYRNDAPPEFIGKSDEEIIKWRLSKKPASRAEQIIEEIQILKENVDKNFGIFCAVCDNDEKSVPGYANNLMWSHYAKNHTGFCLAFNTEKLLTPFARGRSLDTLFQDHVSYDSKFPIISPYKDDGSIGTMTDEEVEIMLLSKHDDWCYEREWRFFGKPKGVEIISPDAIEHVYLGLNVSNQNIELVKSILKVHPSKSKLSKAIRRDGSFELDFQEIEY